MLAEPIFMYVDYANGNSEKLETDVNGHNIDANVLIGGTVQGVYVVDGNGEVADVPCERRLLVPGEQLRVEVGE